MEGVAIQEPKTKKILHQYPLHKISYCADDKAEKRFFSFISKDGDGKHTCFVFVSDKLVRKYFMEYTSKTNIWPICTKETSYRYL